MFLKRKRSKIIREVINVASLKFRIIVIFIIGGLMFVFGLIFIGSILLLIFNKLSFFFLIPFIPLWIIILLFEREFIWTIIFLLKKAPYRHLSNTSGKHEKILEDYLNTIKQKKNRTITSGNK